MTTPREKLALRAIDRMETWAKNADWKAFDAAKQEAIAALTEEPVQKVDAEAVAEQIQQAESRWMLSGANKLGDKHLFMARVLLSAFEATESEATGEWDSVTKEEMWNLIQRIRKITGDDGTFGGPDNLVKSMAEELLRLGYTPPYWDDAPEPVQPDATNVPYFDPKNIEEVNAMMARLSPEALAKLQSVPFIPRVESAATEGVVDELKQWRDLALSAGERLASTGPEGYYGFTWDQFSNWLAGQSHSDVTRVVSLDQIQEIAERIIEKRVEHHSAQDVECPVCVSAEEVAKAIYALQLPAPSATAGIGIEEAVKQAGEKMATFIRVWGDCLYGVQMTVEDFKEDCGLEEWAVALAKLQGVR